MTPRPSGDLVFFIDRSLGRKQVAQALREAGATVEVHDDHFPQTTPDVEWLAEVGRRGWVVLSKDERIRRNRIERAALDSARVRAFFLTQQDITGQEMAELFSNALPGMTRRAVSEPAPFIFTISRSGKFSPVK
ncbi:MAG: hypothetical protein LC123_16595 [Burkholderiales bacterium]|nr:putative ribonuclease VapC45 [Rhodocyclaceae bacterium]MCZ2421442.1 hypothetical protein [Burkholderiales bacterium]